MTNPTPSELEVLNILWELNKKVVVNLNEVLNKKIKRVRSKLKLKLINSVILMSRKPRGSAVGVPQHVIQRGNNQQVLFSSDVE
jgi:Flp pilus assembly protein TadB